jgi:hypothetical protein
VKVDDLGPVFKGFEGEFAQISTDAMRGATAELKVTLRDQVTAAGLGSRLANTWRADSYPRAGRSLNPAGYAWSNAPNIIDAFSSGASIQPVGGHNYLWIPTRSVPRATHSGRASSSRRMSPVQVLATFGQKEFVFRKAPGGRLLAFIVQQRGTTARGRLRKVRKGRIAQGERGQLLLMFTLTRSVRPGKRFDLQQAADHAASTYVERFNQGAR